MTNKTVTAECIELKPCPFCGAPLIEFVCVDDVKVYRHPYNGCFIDVEFKEKSKFSVKWNTRANGAQLLAAQEMDKALSGCLINVELSSMLTGDKVTKAQKALTAWREAEELAALCCTHVDLNGHDVRLVTKRMEKDIATYLQRRNEAHRAVVDELMRLNENCRKEIYERIGANVLQEAIVKSEARDAALEEAAKLSDKISTDHFIEYKDKAVSIDKWTALEISKAIRALKSSTVSRTLAADTSERIVAENSTHEPCSSVFNEEAMPRVDQ